MALSNVRQYVGARYVPKFADPVEWQANTSYEAMVIVTYNNSSYTSKIPVPPTVGNPADNKKYWVRTGDYNAQVEEYRQYTDQVEQNLNTEINNRSIADAKLQQNIDSAHPKKLVILGDSWTIIYDKIIARTLGNFFDTVYDYGVDGSLISFLDNEVNNAKNELGDEINNITDVYVISGTNNVFFNRELTTHYLEYKAHFDTVKNAFKNANLHYFPDTAATGNGGRNGYYQIIMYAAAEAGFAVHPESLLFPKFNNCSSYIGFDTENNVQHLNEQGYIDFSYAIHSLANGGAAPIYIDFDVTGLVWSKIEGSGNVILSSYTAVAHSNGSMGGYVDIHAEFTGTGTCTYRVTKTTNNPLTDTQVKFDDSDVQTMFTNFTPGVCSVHNDSRGIYIHVQSSDEKPYIDLRIPCTDLLGVLLH